MTWLTGEKPVNNYRRRETSTNPKKAASSKTTPRPKKRLYS